MTYNILEGGVGRVDPIAEVIRLAGAEVVILQETTDTELFHRLADRLGMDRFLAENPRENEGPRRASGLLSRLPISRVINLAALDERLTRGVFAATVGEGRQSLDLLGLHLHSKETLADEAVRLREVDAILVHAAKVSPQRVVAGDFNAWHPEQAIDVAKLRAKSRERVEAQGGVLPRQVVERMLAAGYVDAHALGRNAAELGRTLTTAKPAVRVDYFFVPHGMAADVIRCDVFMPEIGRFASDHFPVVMELGGT